MTRTPRKNVALGAGGGSSAEGPRRQGARGFFLLLLTGLVVCFLLFADRRGACGPAELAALPAGINPNTAPMESLIRLEGIGPARAFDIIKYRRERLQEGRAAFRSPRDLEAIRGIGPKTVEKLAGRLVFEASDDEKGS